MSDIIDTQKDGAQACVFGMVVKCMRQTRKAKMDFSICSCCILSRIEKHVYGIARMMHERGGRIKGDVDSYSSDEKVK